MLFRPNPWVMPHLSRVTQAGNTLAEYGFVGATVVTVIIVSMNVAGGNLNDWFGTLKGDMKTKIQTTNTALANHNLAKSGFTAAAPTQVKVVPPVPVPPSAAGGGTSAAFSSSDYTVNLSGKVQTLGANGTTFQLASQLKTLANKLLSEGSITPAGANKILALADQGFRLAGLEKSIEDASKTAGSNQAFLNSSITFDGHSIAMPQVARLIGFGTPTDCNQDIKSNPGYMLQATNASPETLSFINLYNSALSDPSLKSSAQAQGVISQLSSQVAFLSDDVTNLIYGANQTNVTLKDLNNSTASSASNYDSTAICYMGNGCRK